MLNAPSFSEDMLPRHFPKAKGQLELKSAAAPMPTLPGLSLLLDDDNRVVKSEPTRNVEPKKSFEQWKQQHQAMFARNETVYQRKPEKKQVRFETNKSNEQPPNRRVFSPAVPNLELSYYEQNGSARNFSESQRSKDNCQHSPKGNGHCDNSGLRPKCNHAPITPSYSSDKAYNAARQATIELPHFNRMTRSETMKENCISGPYLHSEHRQCNGNCNRTEQNNWKMMDYKTCDHGKALNGCASQRQVQQSHKHEVQPKDVFPFDAHSAHIERNFKAQMTDDTLVSIMEEQQQHILLQQSQIMMQQKQNMMQQQQIFMLQHQVQKLLLRSGTNPNESPNQHCPTSICDQPSPRSIANALQNTSKTRSGPIDSLCNGAKASSIGVMTSFLGNVNDGMPNGLHQFNEQFTAKLANEKFIENMGGFSTEEYSDKDSMLDKINDAIKNSPALIDYRNSKTADGYSSPKRQSDINIAAQALFYETSSTNNGSANEPKTTDRSFALYMLGMKYDCAQEDASKRDWHPQQTNAKTDQVSVNLSPEVYDYLKRHGLLSQE